MAGLRMPPKGNGIETAGSRREASGVGGMGGLADYLPIHEPQPQRFSHPSADLASVAPQLPGNGYRVILGPLLLQMGEDHSPGNCL